jgi:hypothetical protein
MEGETLGVIVNWDFMEIIVKHLVAVENQPSILKFLRHQE